MKTLIIASASILLMSFACSRLSRDFIENNKIELDNIYDSSRKGDLENIKKLYKIDSDTISKADERGFTPLILATYHNNENVVDFLIEKKVEIDNADQIQTALQGASYKGYSSIAKKLLNAGAHPNYTDMNGMTALHYAVQFGHSDIVKELIKYNADPSIKDDNGVTPIDIAKQKDDSGMLSILGIK